MSFVNTQKITRPSEREKERERASSELTAAAAAVLGLILGPDRKTENSNGVSKRKTRVEICTEISISCRPIGRLLDQIGRENIQFYTNLMYLPFRGDKTINTKLA